METVSLEKKYLKVNKEKSTMKYVCVWCGKEFDGGLIFDTTWCSKKCEYEYKKANDIHIGF